MVNIKTNKDILSENLKRLMDSHKHTQGDLHRLTKVSQSTIGRIINKQVDATIGTMEVIASKYGLQSWQLLVPELNPSNPPVLREISEKERIFYDSIKLAAQELAKYE